MGPTFSEINKYVLSHLQFQMTNFFQTTLRNCSIVVQNVTEQDEGCYLCLFITSSDMAYYGKACLHTYGKN
uniref:Immunoglobulin V-set domain-containing protein n=1 Tax=Neogobius melanostomus TaxID=47308 RepID=A0A8C6TSR6_9GOBI